MSHETKLTEDGYLVDETGEILNNPEPEPTATRDTPRKSVNLVPGLDFELSAQEAAALATDILRQTLTVSAFRQLVLDGHAPEPETSDEDKKPGTPKWSMIAIRKWATDLAAEEATQTSTDPEAAAQQESHADDTSESPVDFLLSARDSAGFISELLGRRLSTVAFRQLVVAGNAPRPTQTIKGTSKWSLITLQEWADAVLQAEAEAALQIDQDEVAREHTQAFVAWVHTRISRFESFSSKSRWCPQWWKHHEAVDRFHALWVAYLQAEENNELSGWWVNHWDRQSPMLFDSQGMFSRCIDGHVEEQEESASWRTPQNPQEQGWVLTADVLQATYEKKE